MAWGFLAVPALHSGLFAGFVVQQDAVNLAFGNWNRVYSAQIVDYALTGTRGRFGDDYTIYRGDRGPSFNELRYIADWKENMESDDFRQRYDVVWQGSEDFAQAVRLGSTCSQLESAAYEAATEINGLTDDALQSFGAAFAGFNPELGREHAGSLLGHAVHSPRVHGTRRTEAYINEVVRNGWFDSYQRDVEKVVVEFLDEVAALTGG